MFPCPLKGYIKGLFFVLAVTVVALYAVNTSAGEKKEQRQLQPIYDYKAELKLTDEQVMVLKENIASLGKEGDYKGQAGLS